MSERVWNFGWYSTTVKIVDGTLYYRNWPLKASIPLIDIKGVYYEGGADATMIIEVEDGKNHQVPVPTKDRSKRFAREIQHHIWAYNRANPFLPPDPSPAPETPE